MPLPAYAFAADKAPRTEAFWRGDGVELWSNPPESAKNGPTHTSGSATAST